MKPRDSTDEEIEAFQDAMARLAGFDERVSPEWADGYLTALAAGPRALSVDEWLPKIGGDAFERCFADPPDAAAARRALAARWAVLLDQLDAESLLDQPDALRLQPHMAMWDDAARERAVADGEVSAEDARTLVTGSEWVRGFFDATVDFIDDWQHDAEGDDAELHDTLMQHVAAVAWADGSPELTAHVQHHYPKELPSRDDLIDEACFAVQDLRVWWLDYAPRPETRRVEPTPGRNDPCPCGSGRKFKKCHGA